MLQSRKLGNLQTAPWRLRAEASRPYLAKAAWIYCHCLNTMTSTCISPIAAVAFVAALLVFPAHAADANLGRNLAANCANCHGTNGVSSGGIASLAGQPPQTLLTALREFRAGTRPATIMHQLAKGYSDEQLEALAAFFAAQKAK